MCGALAVSVAGAVAAPVAAAVAGAGAAAVAGAVTSRDFGIEKAKLGKPIFTQPYRDHRRAGSVLKNIDISVKNIELWLAFREA